MGISIGEGRRRDYKDFSLRMSSSLSLIRWGVVETFLRVFLSIGSLPFMWIIRVYII